jgi:hypothetical protein
MDRLGLAQRYFDAWNESAAHNDAMRRFFGPDFAAGGQTGVWTAERLNGRLGRCLECGTMMRAAETCRCGAPLPAAPAWW